MNDSTVAPAPRVAVLWARLSGYMHACLQALLDEGAEVLVVHTGTVADAPFELDRITSGLRVHSSDGSSNGPELERLVSEFDPDAVLINSWHRPAYRRVGRALSGRSVRILAMDNQWLGTPKQWAGIVASRVIVRPVYDAVFVPGDTQASFARKLGFSTERTLWGLYCCDHERFSAVAQRRNGDLPPKAFLFVGRLVPEKGVDVLAASYQRYRAAVDDPWPLLVAGTGPQDDLLAKVPGVEMLGFVQPADLPTVFAQAGCLVLPSRFEPWATVIHEAAAAGLSVVASRACGATTRLVLDGYNGVVVSPDDAVALEMALSRIHRSDEDERRAMSAASEALAAQFTPKRWAEYLLQRVSELRLQLGL